MNPSPTIVTDVPVEPAITEDGVIAVMAGMGFEVGVGLGGAVIPPPQPVITHMQLRTVAESKDVARFMMASYIRSKLKPTYREKTEDTIPSCI